MLQDFFLSFDDLGSAIGVWDMAFLVRDAMRCMPDTLMFAFMLVMCSTVAL